MGREILFRAKHIHVVPQNRHLDGKWVEGYLSGKSFIFELKSETEVLVDPETVCEYTGLTDKNGRKIFEGDIVEVTEGSLDCDSGKGNVIFYEGLWYVDGEPQNSLYDLRNIGDHDIEVIGNIFDNPELLEGGTERKQYW